MAGHAKLTKKSWRFRGRANARGCGRAFAHQICCKAPGLSALQSPKKTYCTQGQLSSLHWKHSILGTQTRGQFLTQLVGFHPQDPSANIQFKPSKSFLTERIIARHEGVHEHPNTSAQQVINNKAELYPLTRSSICFTVDRQSTSSSSICVQSETHLRHAAKIMSQRNKQGILVGS